MEPYDPAASSHAHFGGKKEGEHPVDALLPVALDLSAVWSQPPR